MLGDASTEYNAPAATEGCGVLSRTSVRAVRLRVRRTERCSRRRLARVWAARRGFPAQNTMSAKSVEQVRAEVGRLSALKVAIKPAGGRRADYVAAIEAQILVLERQLSADEVRAMFLDGASDPSGAHTLECAIEAVEWRLGELVLDEPSSVGWKGMVRPAAKTVAALEPSSFGALSDMARILDGIARPDRRVPSIHLGTIAARTPMSFTELQGFSAAEARGLVAKVRSAADLMFAMKRIIVGLRAGPGAGRVQTRRRSPAVRHAAAWIRRRVGAAAAAGEGGAGRSCSGTFDRAHVGLPRDPRVPVARRRRRDVAGRELQL
jgi:hypothetical protein